MQLDIFKLYIDALLNPKNKIENINQIKFIYDIFIYDTVFYSQSSNIGSNFKVFLTKFFNLYYPKDTSIKHKVGDIMDVYINEDRNKQFLQGWIQLKIKKIDEEKKLYFFEDYKDRTKEINFPMDSFLAQERNTFVKEEEMKWRDNLNPGDKIDFLTNTITRNSAAFPYGGGGEPISPHKLASKKMSFSERIKLKKILKKYNKNEEIWVNDELSKMLIF